MVGPWATLHRSVTFHQNPFLFCSSYPANKQTDLQTEGWQNTAKCRQAKQLVKQPNIRLTKYALKLSRKDLVGLLKGHADLNRHLTLMQVCNDEICPLCQEAEETTLHLLGKCCALINQRLEILGSHYLQYDDLALLHWRPLLRLAKASKRF